MLKDQITKLSRLPGYGLSMPVHESCSSSSSVSQVPLAAVNVSQWSRNVVGEMHLHFMFCSYYIFCHAFLAEQSHFFLHLLLSQFEGISLQIFPIMHPTIHHSNSYVQLHIGTIQRN